MYRLLMLMLVVVLIVPSPVAADEPELAALRATFENAVAALNGGNLDGFLSTVHEEALSFYSCGPTSGKQGREACALDWQLFFDKSTNARFETRNEQYRIIGDAGIAYGEYGLSVNYNGQGRQTVHEGRYTITYTKIGDGWQVIMQHNTPAAEDPQPARTLRDGAPAR